MKRGYLILIIILVVFLIALIVYSSLPIKQVCFKENCFQVELAKTREQRVLGLKDRNSLEENKGMLFIFEDSDIHGFWMKEMRFPLDMIWVSKDKEIVAIKENAEPCLEDECPTIVPYENSLYVLEINAGLIEKYNLTAGNKISFRRF
jgi:uncharacterized protein